MFSLKPKIKKLLGKKKTAEVKRVLPIARAVKTAVCWILVAILTLAVVTFFFLRSSGDSPSVFGCSLHRIESPSMEPEIRLGDIIINIDIKDASEIRVGDIVTFNSGPEYNNVRVTHRVVTEPHDNGSGRMVLVTKGDRNDEDDGEIDVASVESKFSRRAGFLTLIYHFFFSGWGIAVFLILLALIFFSQLRNIFRLTSSKYREEEEDDDDEADASESEPSEMTEAPESAEEAPESMDAPDDTEDDGSESLSDYDLL